MGIRERHEELLDKVRKGEPMTKAEMLEAEALGKILTQVRLDELESKRMRGGLSPSEQKEYERLFNTSPQDARLREMKELRDQRLRILEDARRAERQVQLTHIFRTPVTRKGQRVVLSDNTANVALLESLLNPDEEVTVDWFNAHYNEPSFDRLSWSDWLSPTQRKTEEQKVAQANRQRALQLCRDHNLSECQSNLDILMTHDGDVIVIPDGAYLFNDNEELQLVPASQAELQKYTAEKEATRVGHLQNLAQTNNVAELRRIAKQDAMGQQQSLESTRQQILNRDLAYQYERDQMAGYVTPLPAQITPEQIRKWDANQMRSQMKRYGASRISARLHQITEVPNGHGGTYKFEE